MASPAPGPFYPAPSETRVLLIGVSRYDHDSHDNLHSVEANLDQLENVLTHHEHGKLPPSSVRRLLDPRLDEVLPAVQSAAGEAKQLLLCYFSGHGHLDPESPNQLYLLPRNAHGEEPTSYAVRYSLLRGELAKSNARHVVLILDCCYSGNATPPVSDGTFTLITSSNPLRRQDQGDGIHPTPFTAALLKLLRDGISPNQLVTVDRLFDPLKQLAKADAERAEDGQGGYNPPDNWHPRVVTVNGPGDTVLSHSLQGRRRSPWQRRREFLLLWLRNRVNALRRRFQNLARPIRRAVVVTAVLTLLLGLAWAVLPQVRKDGPADCGVPLQLRIATTPEYEESLAEIAAQFEQALWTAAGDADWAAGIRPPGCPQVDTYVYGAPGSAVTGALANSAVWADPKDCPEAGEATSAAGATRQESGGECLQPLHDVGPLPDVWFAPLPEVAELLAENELALSSAEARFGEVTVVARSPAVLAVPGELDGVEQTGEPLRELLDAVAREGLTVRRATPASSAASLVFGVAAQRKGAPLDNDVSVLPSDDDALVCSLAETTEEGAVDGEAAWPTLLLAERSVVPLARGEQSPACLSNVNVDDASYHAYYPEGVAPLDLSLVPVLWEGTDADEEERGTAIALLRQWLGDDEGQDLLARHGFRGPKGHYADVADAGTNLPLNHTAFSPQKVAEVDPVDELTPADAAAYLNDPAERLRPLDVVFVVDLSSSSYVDDRARLTDSALREAVTALADTAADTAADDEQNEQQEPYRYAVLTAPADAGGGVGTPVESLGAHGVRHVGNAIDAFAALPADAPIRDAVNDGLDLLSGSDEEGRAPVLVLITDDEDSDELELPDRDRAPAASIVVVSLGQPGCADSFNKKLLGPDDLCIDSARNHVVALRAALTDRGE